MKTNQGSTIIYIVLLIFMLMTSSAIVLTTILSKHVRAAENYLSSEQAFAAANSSIEEISYKIFKQNEREDVTSEGTITYNEGASNAFEVDFNGEGCATEEGPQVLPHITAAGTYKSLVRRIDFGGGKRACP